MTESVEIRILGPFEVAADGRAVAVTGSKRDALLTLLALGRGRVVAVDALIDGLWGEELPAAPRNAVQHHITRLRAALGQDAIAATPEGYALRHASVDALGFEELLTEARSSLRRGDARQGAHVVERALALWRGPALHGLPQTPWLAAEARRLETLRIDALEEQFEAALALGEHVELVPRIQQAVEESPFRERLWGQLMLALYRAGRQADALETFQDARRVLSEELGLDPGPDLQRVQAAILAHDPAIAAVSAPARRRGNLPAPMTSFVGRDQELARIVEAVRTQRLVTITGPPGVGKSRLALEAARSLEQEVPDGIWWVDLARAGSTADVARLVTDTLEVDGGGRLDVAAAQLRDADAVVVLDGCARFVDEAARIASAMLGQCSGVRVLATSREVLHVPGEARVALLPLPLDGHGSDASVAVELFVQRARAVRTEFEPSGDEERLMSEICRRLDGLPLAIELAAARAGALGLSEIRSALVRRFEWLLADGRPVRDEAAALAALVGWSYELLHGDEKTLLHQFAVHRGGAPLAALVAGGASRGLDETTVTQLVGALVDKSVVTVSFRDGEARYGLLDTVREYALERLTESGDLAAVRAAHAAYFASLAAAARAGLRGADWLTSLGHLQRETDNFWAALTYAREAHDPTTAVTLGASLGLYFILGERISEGRRFLELALACATDDAPVRERVELLGFLSYLATEESDLEAAVATGEHAVELAETKATPTEAAFARLTLSFAFIRLGECERAARLAGQALATFEQGGDHWGAATAVLASAQCAVVTADVDAVARLTPDVVRHCEAIGFEAFEVPAALLDAWVAERRDDLDGAGVAYRRALELAERIGFADHASFALTGLGAIAQERQNLAEAEELYRRALASAESAEAAWATAHARVHLADVLETRGDRDTAERLRQSVVEWSRAPGPHRTRETLFLELAGHPAGAPALDLARTG